VNDSSMFRLLGGVREVSIDCGAAGRRERRARLDWIAVSSRNDLCIKSERHVFRVYGGMLQECSAK
jgi:hypothetical protein